MTPPPCKKRRRRVAPGIDEDSDEDSGSDESDEESDGEENNGDSDGEENNEGDGGDEDEDEDPDGFVGKEVRKDFGTAHGVHKGTVVGVTAGVYRIEYDDGDAEEMDADEVAVVLLAEGGAVQDEAHEGDDGGEHDGDDTPEAKRQCRQKGKK